MMMCLVASDDFWGAVGVSLSAVSPLCERFLWLSCVLVFESQCVFSTLQLFVRLNRSWNGFGTFQKFCKHCLDVFANIMDSCFFEDVVRDGTFASP